MSANNFFFGFFFKILYLLDVNMYSKDDHSYLLQKLIGKYIIDSYMWKRLFTLILLLQRLLHLLVL